eukprot:403349432
MMSQILGSKSLREITSYQKIRQEGKIFKAKLIRKFLKKFQSKLQEILISNKIIKSQEINGGMIHPIQILFKALLKVQVEKEERNPEQIPLL